MSVSFVTVDIRGGQRLTVALKDHVHLGWEKLIVYLVLAWRMEMKLFCIVHHVALKILQGACIMEVDLNGRPKVFQCSMLLVPQTYLEYARGRDKLVAETYTERNWRLLPPFGALRPGVVPPMP